MCCRLPSGSVHPTTTNSSRLRHFDLTQIPRSPGAYGRSARLEMTPSRPSLQACSRKRGPSPVICSLYRSPWISFLLEQPLEPLLALDERQLCGALAVQVQKIDGEEHELIR